MPAERVAQILDVPVGTVHSRLHHAMRAMRAALDADERPAAREASR
jgi:DNA-directed RNA polymerase specialized sigma24 family protein